MRAGLTIRWSMWIWSEFLQEKMRVAIYNQMFGLDGRRFLKNLAGHWAVHFQSNEERIWERTDLRRTINILKESDADIIGICEVLDKQQTELRGLLGNLGYNSIYFGTGHKLKHHNMHVTEAIASKIPCRNIELGKWPVEDRLGGGGGFVCIKMPKPNLHLISVHLALSSRKYFRQQIEFLAEKINEMKGKIILMGDFNLEYKRIKDDFPELGLISHEIKTCSRTPVMKLFCNKDLDHIFVRGFAAKAIGGIEGYSDHKLIYADLE